MGDAASRTINNSPGLQPGEPWERNGRCGITNDQ